MMLQLRALLLVFVGTIAAAPVYAANTWDVIAARSELNFEVTFYGEPLIGEFEVFSADVAFDPRDLGRSHARVDVQVSSIASGIHDLAHDVEPPEWLDFAVFPSVRFEAQSFRALGGDRFEADSLLTIRDITRNVVLSFTYSLDREADIAELVGKLVLDRTDYSVGTGVWDDDEIVGKEVTLNFRLTAAVD